jgi:predicted dehydrogenase
VKRLGDSPISAASTGSRFKTRKKYKSSSEEVKQSVGSPARMQPMINVAVVGLGGIGTLHAGCYETDARSRVVAVCDLIPERAQNAAERFSCPSFTSVADLLASDVQVDAASVCSAGVENGGDHYTPTMELLGAGIPVLGEKPISNRIDEAREMVALAKEKQIPYAINLNHRFTPAALRAKEWLAADRIGDLDMVRMTMWINNPNESAPWFHARALHPHSLDVMRYFAGDVRRVHAFARKGKGRVIYSQLLMNLEFASGAIGTLTGSYDAGPRYGLELCDLLGSSGRIVIENACEVLSLYSRSSTEIESYERLGGMNGFGETFQSRISAWLDDLERGVPANAVDAKGQDALAVQLVIEAAIRSAETGTVVEVEAL